MSYLRSASSIYLLPVACGVIACACASEASLSGDPQPAGSPSERVEPPPQTPEPVPVAEQITLSNAGSGMLEGHTPRGFQGMGSGLFVGDEINPNFPEDDGVQVFLSFALGNLPGATIERAQLASEVSPRISGDPFNELGMLLVEEVQFDAFSSAVFDLGPGPEDLGCVFATSDEGPFSCEITDLVQAAVAEGRAHAQVRLRFERASNANRTADLVAFFLTDSNTNEPNIFSLTLDVLP